MTDDREQKEQAIISRSAARAAGLSRFYTGKPCLYDHVAERRVSNSTCIECERRWKKHNSLAVKGYRERRKRRRQKLQELREHGAPPALVFKATIGMRLTPEEQELLDNNSHYRRLVKERQK